jgi:hypothetical protein
VEGDLENPEFSFGHLIGKAIVNLITKIVTAPFRALAALLGIEGEDLERVAFDPGKGTVPPPEAEKLTHLAEAMAKRPQLNLAVQGQYHPESDAAALRELSLRGEIAKRLGTPPAPGEDPGPVDYGSRETADLLLAMFAERFGSDALKAFSEERKPPARAKESKTEAEDPGELAKALYARLAESQPLAATALAELAAARAQAVVELMTAKLGLAPQRLGVLEAAAAGDQTAPAATLQLTAGAASAKVDHGASTTK